MAPIHPSEFFPPSLSQSSSLQKILNEWDSKPFEKPSVVLPILAGVLDELKQGLKWFSANSMSSPSEVDINGHAIKISPLEKNIIATCLQTSTYQ
ncbi:hypothetical protein DSO57_1017547 [Entomophthora muscae]|uniref:Uncharacterized protein n=1 Tax=Entomophthora muscae TaxID=34485 RepID=A0ACC2STX1_9FUNG|nr:hypothetical protein DSO57_1017547 [Entomophthora muscae]